MRHQLQECLEEWLEALESHYDDTDSSTVEEATQHSTAQRMEETKSHMMVSQIWVGFVHKVWRLTALRSNNY